MIPKTKNGRRHNKYDSSLQLASVMGAGANKIKRQIRNVERLLQKKRDVLPDTVIVEKERALEALKLELKEAEMRQVVRKNAKKYHMIRFFERKKALRRYKQTLKQLKSDPDNEQLLSELEERKIDLCYVVNFPKTTKYIALYPTTEEESLGDMDNKNGSVATENKRRTYRAMITEQLKNNKLPVSLEQIIAGKNMARHDSGVTFDENNADKGTSEGMEEVERENESEVDDFFE